MLRGDGGYGAASSARPLRQGQTGSLAPFESLPVSTGPGEAGRAMPGADVELTDVEAANVVQDRARSPEAEVPEPVCRICHDDLSAPPGHPVTLECACKGGLRAAHKRCALRWFRSRGDAVCEVCNRHTGLSLSREDDGTRRQGRAEARTRPPRTPLATTPRRLQTTTPRSAGATTRRILERQPMVMLPAKPPRSRVVFGGEARDEARDEALGSGTTSSAARSSLRTRFTIPTRDPTFVRDPTSRRAPHAHMRRDVSIASFVMSTRRDPREVSRYATSRRWSLRSSSRRRF
jgi:hypothetical protein